MGRCNDYSDFFMSGIWFPVSHIFWYTNISTWQEGYPTMALGKSGHCRKSLWSIPLFPIVMLKVLVLNLIGSVWIMYLFKPITLPQGIPCSLTWHPRSYAHSWNWGCAQLNPVICTESRGDMVYHKLSREGRMNAVSKRSRVYMLGKLDYWSPICGF